MSNSPTITVTKQDAQLSQRDRASGCISLTKSGTVGLYYGHYRSVFNHCDIIGLQSCRIRWKTQNKGYYAVQGHWVIQVGTNRKPVCDFLLVINSNWHPISYGTVSELSQLIVQILALYIFEPPAPLGSLGTTYDVYLGLIRKHVGDFLLVLIELFFARCYGWGATSENTGYRKSAISL